MQKSHYIYNDSEIEHPRCLVCGVAMWLTRLEPDKPDHDRRTFECKSCGVNVTKIVKYK